ncbi:MAG: hypothetical protein OJF59_002921 [Cytophagales bacterium]|jgi:DNA polymerase III psi subunit|nr:DNA polymerase III subunit psi [Bacteroidota bacterium]MBS1979634.1 DNA polymerase III subunit psi [Bacteroidota bacterium]WHZ09165.1 MAG: hypothetical protein OJF59_002921 [Cytophagales bacterium]
MDFDLINSTYTEELYSIPAKPAVIIDKEWHEMSVAEAELLPNILQAIHQKPDAVTIICQATLDLNLLPGNPSHVIYFGKPVTGIASYEVIETQKIKLVASDRLEDLVKDYEAKNKLWRALKKQFCVA